MACVFEDSDEEYLDDPIRLIDFEQKRIKLACSSVQESIEISDSDVDIVSLPPPKAPGHLKPARASCNIVSSTLPVAFFKISRNIDFLNKCLPLRIKIVDCDKHSWYYRRKYKNIKFEHHVLDVRDVTNKNTKTKIEGSHDVETMKLKIRPVDVESYMKSPIRGMKTTMCIQNNNYLNKPTVKGSDETNVPLQNIDFKKNQGLVGLKIVYEADIENSNSKIESPEKVNKAKISKCDSHNRNDQNIKNKSSPKNSQQKRDIQLSSALLSASNLENAQKTNHKEKSHQLNSESLKLQGTTKVVERKVCNEKTPNLTKVVEIPKKYIKKKCPDQKPKPNVSGKELKVIKETAVAEIPKINDIKCSNIKETVNKASQKNEMKIIHSEKYKMTKKTTKSKRQISQKIEKEAVLKNDKSQKVKVDHTVPVSTKTASNLAKNSERNTVAKPKSFQQNINNINDCEQRQDNPLQSDKRIYRDQIPLSVARVPTSTNMQNIQKKLLIPPNKEVRSEIKINNNFPISSIMRQQAKKNFVLTDINDKKIDLFSSQVPGGWKNIRQSDLKETLCSIDLTLDNKNNMKTDGDTKPESKFLRLDEGNTLENKMTKKSFNTKSDMPITSKEASSQSSVKSLLKMPVPSKKENQSGLKQELSKQQLIIGRSEHLPNKQAPAPNKKVVVYPVSHYNALCENNLTTTSQTAQEKQSVLNEKLTTYHNDLSTCTLTVPTSIHQMLPSLDPRLVRYQIVSQNGSLPKELSSSVSQTKLNEKMISTPSPNTKTPQNILNHARIIIKRPNAEPNSILGQQIKEQLQGHGNGSPNKTFKLIPTLTSTQKGRYVIVNNSVINRNILVGDQHKNFGSYSSQERLQQQHTMPKQNTASHYEAPRVSLHKSQVAPKEHSTNKQSVLNQAPGPEQHLNLYPQNQLFKRNSTQYPNPQPNAHNHNHNALQAPPSNILPNPNPHLPYSAHNEHAQYYNVNSHLNTNQVPLSNQQPKQNEYGSYYNNNTTLNAGQVPLLTQSMPNEYESYNNHTRVVDSYQASAHQQEKPNEHGPNQNTILNLDTNTITQPTPLYDYIPQNVNNMDCAYWNGVNYLGDEWQQRYPQLTQPPPPAFHQYLPPLPEHQQPPQFPYSQYLPPPPTMQHPQPSMALHFPSPTSVSQHPQPTSVSQNLPPPAVTQYRQLTPIAQHPPPPVPQHSTPPPLPHPPSLLSAIVTQGSTILGANNNGVVRTINLVTSTTTSPKVATSSNSLTDENNIPVNTKSEMLQELSKSLDVEGPNLKRSLSDSHKELSKSLNGRPLSGPLAKVRKMEGLAKDPSSTQKALNNGYSPPILPIPTYEKTFEYIAQVSGSVEKTSTNRIDATVDKCNSKKIEGILKKKSDLDGCADGDKGEKSVKKISIHEYKNRTHNNKQEEKVENVMKTDIKSESKFDDTDLGYDSDRTVIL